MEQVFMNKTGQKELKQDVSRNPQKEQP